MSQLPKKVVNTPVCVKCGADVSGARIKSKDILNNSYTPKMYECPACGTQQITFDGRISLGALTRWMHLNGYTIDIQLAKPADPVIPPLPSPQADSK